MSTQVFKRIAVFSFVALFSTLACNQPPDNNPTAPTGSAVNTLDLIGPANIVPGQPVQFSTSMRLADGTVKSGSTATDVRWRSSNTSVLQVSPTGLVTPVASKGDAFITAEVRGTINRTATREVIVQPEGTFRLVGQIQELNAPGFQVAGARVEVVGGASVAIADAVGNYRLYGVPAAADIRVSANAYADATFSVQLSGNSTRNFALELISPRPTFSGNFTMSIDVTSPCTNSPALSTDLQHRSYEAVVTQSGVTVDVLLTSGQFRVNGLNRGNSFKGSLVPGGVRFSFMWYDSYYYPWYGPEYYPDIAEQVSGSRYLVPQGTWNSTGTPGSSLIGTITNGSLALWDSAFPGSTSRYLGGCFGTLTLKLVPR